MYKKTPTKPPSMLDKKIPKSSKYANIEAKLDTGLTVHKVRLVSLREISKRRDELFYRITKHQLFELFNEYEVQNEDELVERVPSPHNTVVYEEYDEPAGYRPYLILDVRETIDYNTCHLLRAKSYPYQLIRRDQVLAEMYRFKNKEEHLIILYCDDERISRDVAKTLVDRGFDNTFVLTGGIREFAAHYPEFIQGDNPFPLSPKKTSVSPHGLTRAKLEAISEDHAMEHFQTNREAVAKKYSSPSGHTGSRSVAGSSSMRSNAYRRSSRKSDSGTSSIASNMSVAESIISRAIARKGKL